jgi:hypothetical protein
MKKCTAPALVALILLGACASNLVYAKQNSAETIVTVGFEISFDSPFLIDQLYINDGRGNSTNESNRLPQIAIGGQCVVAGDYDRDMDLYVGGRQIPCYYPYVFKSYLYQNNGVSFIDVTLNPPAHEGGLVTDALFDDIDSDLDLIVVGEWMPISFFPNNSGLFSEVTVISNPKAQLGWWHSIGKDDFNGDGKNHYIVGNLGENNKFHPSEKYPLELHIHDFDVNQTNDIVLGEYQECKDMAIIKFHNETLLITVSNQAKSKTFRLKNAPNDGAY